MNKKKSQLPSRRLHGRRTRGTHPNAGLLYSCTRIRRKTGGKRGGLAELHVTSHSQPPTRPGCPARRDTSLTHVQDVFRTPGHVPYTSGMSRTPGRTRGVQSAPAGHRNAFVNCKRHRELFFLHLYTSKALAQNIYCGLKGYL